MYAILGAVFVISSCTAVRANALALPIQNITCGRIPQHTFGCYGSPAFMPDPMSSECRTLSNQCAQVNCLLAKYNVTKDGTIDKQVLTTYYNDFAKEYPEWAHVMEHAKVACLREGLPPQSVYMECPAVDIVFCTGAAFMKLAKPSQWSSSPECEAGRRFAAACPICPEDCFNKNVPISEGSCNACKE